MFKRHTFTSLAALLVLIVGLLLPFNAAFAAGDDPQKPTVAPMPHVVSREKTAKPSAATVRPTDQPKPRSAPTVPHGGTLGYDVSLASSNDGPQVNEYFTLTATANQDVKFTPYSIVIYQLVDSGPIIQTSCGTGNKCTLIMKGALAGVDLTFQARIAYDDGLSVQAWSNYVTVHIYAPFSVSLVSSNYTPQANQNYTLTATANQALGPGYVIQIYYGANLQAACGSNATCSVTLSNPALGSYTFNARIAHPDGSSVLAFSNPVTVTTSFTFGVTLIASNYNPHVNQTYTLIATANQDVGVTPYYIEIYQGSIQKARCGSGTTCIVLLTGHTAGVSKTYQARIASPDGTIVPALSNIVTVHIRQ